MKKKIRLQIRFNKKIEGVNLSRNPSIRCRYVGKCVAVCVTPGRFALRYNGQFAFSKSPKLFQYYFSLRLV